MVCILSALLAPGAALAQETAPVPTVLDGLMQQVPSVEATQNLSPERPAVATKQAATDSLRAWEGLEVVAVEFKGVDRSRLEPLPGELALQPNHPLSSENVRESLRRLYATGLYKEISVEGERNGDQVTIRFDGTPQLFLGRVTVQGVNSDLLASQLQRATRLNAGTRYDKAKMDRAGDLLRETLEENGYYLSSFDEKQTKQVEDSQVNIQYIVNLGKQARVGAVQVRGNPGMTEGEFRKKGKLREGSKVTRDTVSRALNKLRKNYEEKKRLEANVALESKKFEAPKNRLNYAFEASEGPKVEIHVEGAKLSRGKVKSLVPVYEEGTVDEDLLNEGNRRIRDYFQREGYFNVKVQHTRSAEGTGAAARTDITFDVHLGERRKVKSVKVTGNHYFSNDVIDPRLSVQAANLFIRHGMYSQALVDSDRNAISALYQSNGFSHVTVTPLVKEIPKGPGNKIPALEVTYKVDEGVQDRIGRYQIEGNSQVPLSTLKGLLSTQEGQPYSAVTIEGDRDSILTYYYSHGFDHATVGLTQEPEGKHPNVIDITMHVTEGDQIFVNKVLVSGLHFTRPSTVEPFIQMKPGQPLNQTELLQMQRRLYDLTLFNEVNTAVQDPGGDVPRKNVLVQFSEAKRWDLSYGVGFQAQTGNPSTNCPNTASLVLLGLNPAKYGSSCSPNGKTGASALVLFNVSRINLWGRNQSVTLQAQYGTLEQSATTLYSYPHIFNSKTLNFSLSGGYTSAQDVTTFAASRLEGTVRFTQRPDPVNTMLYQFTYRRVKVDPNTVQVAPNEIPLVSEPVRVGGPGITWIRDTRRPTALDATSGTYTSVEEFTTDNIFASEANFNRLDMTNSSYYKTHFDHIVVARNTRFGFERAFGESKYEYIPLPERLYAGGAQSLRAYSINSAGPRDSLTGFPVGGAGVFVNSTELRFPNPTLPYFGKTLGFVLFHDMGNVFNNSSDIWPSFLRTRQPHSATCKDLSATDQEKVTRSSSTNTTGTCDFNYFTDDVGLGLRYHTPIGPVRLDFSVTPNPPIYPVIITYTSEPTGPYVGQAAHFNFFFSIGQAF
ncbi:MAG TPA: POTRA domain-containing protein [Acidobacteriaceae bacterium]|nr:POTRA domain-containing protein [Acidobacteriaceae bacterium]